MIEIPKNKKVILFDGVCNLCNNAVKIVLKYDHKNTFIFTAIQSESGRQILKTLEIDPLKTDSIILFEPGVCYEIKSTAALCILNDFGGLWKISKIGFILPIRLRDLIYDYIAKNRYRWFGKKNECMVPSKETKAKFLD
jgi:predicted DCC family thiol-disulfide oxidoreductase YuxK